GGEEVDARMTAPTPSHHLAHPIAQNGPHDFLAVRLTPQYRPGELGGLLGRHFAGQRWLEGINHRFEDGRAGCSQALFHHSGQSSRERMRRSHPLGPRLCGCKAGVAKGLRRRARGQTYTAAHVLSPAPCRLDASSADQRDFVEGWSRVTDSSVAITLSFCEFAQTTGRRGRDVAQSSPAGTRRRGCSCQERMDRDAIRARFEGTKERAWKKADEDAQRERATRARSRPQPPA